MAGKNRSSLKAIALIFIIIIVFGVCYCDFYYGKGYTKSITSILNIEKLNKVEETYAEESAGAVPSNETADALTLEKSTKFSIYTYKKGFIYCTKDGVKFYSSITNPKWNHTYNMSNPVTVNEGEYTAVGEMLGRSIMVYDAEGLKYSVNTDGTIMYVALNESGALAVITDNVTGYRAQVYNESGEMKFQRFDEISGVYPLCLDISDDGKVLAVGYIDTTDTEITSRVLFFNVNKADNKNAQTTDMFAAYEKKGEIVPFISCMQNNFIAFFDESISALNIEGSFLWEYKLTNKLDMVSTDNKNIIALGYGESLSVDEGKEKGTLEILNIKGKLKGSLSLGGQISYLKASEYGVIAGSDKDFYAVSDSGKVLWRHKANQDIVAILPMDSINKTLYVTGTFAKIVDMSKIN